jgi:hypothetical protein
LGANLIFAIPFGALMQYLWGLINSLQTVYIAVLLNLQYTSNIKLVLQDIAFVGNIDLWQAEKYFFNPYFNFRETPSFSSEADALDMGGSVFIVLLGSMFISMMLFIPYVIVVGILKCVVKEVSGCHRVRECVKPIQFIQIFVIFIMEGFIEIALSAAFTLTYLSAD